MNVIKLGLLSIIGLFVVVCFFSILMPSTVLVSRAIDINAPVDSIKFYVADLQQWVYWVKGMNSNAVKIESATNADLGRQQLHITSITDSTVLCNWDSQTASTQVSTIHFIPATEKNLTIVHWQFVQKLRWYPWEKFGSFMNDKILGPMMEQNLQNLKRLAEHQPVSLDTKPIEANH